MQMKNVKKKKIDKENIKRQRERERYKAGGDCLQWIQTGNWVGGRGSWGNKKKKN